MDDGASVLEHLLEFSRFVQIRHNIASSHKLSVDEQLGERRPVPVYQRRSKVLRVHLQILSNGRTRKDISTSEVASYESRQLRKITQVLQNVHHTQAKTTHGSRRRSLHKQHHLVVMDDLKP